MMTARGRAGLAAFGLAVTGTGLLLAFDSGRVTGFSAADVRVNHNRSPLALASAPISSLCVAGSGLVAAGGAALVGWGLTESKAGLLIASGLGLAAVVAVGMDGARRGYETVAQHPRPHTAS